MTRAKKWLTVAGVASSCVAGAWLLWGGHGASASAKPATVSERVALKEPTGPMHLEVRNDRIVAHVPPGSRDKPMTVRDFAEELEIPGLLSVAGQPDPYRAPGFTEIEREKAEGAKRRWKQANPEIVLRKRFLKDQRRQLKKFKSAGVPVPKPRARDRVTGQRILKEWDDRQPPRYQDTGDE